MFYERKIGDIPVNEYWAAIDKIIEHKVSELFLKYLPELKNYVNAVKSNSEDLMNTKEVCKRLNFSRQTLSNWYKNEKNLILLEGTLIKMGSKNMYRFNQLKQIIENNPLVFGGDRDYKYKRQINESTDVHKVSNSTEKILNENISNDLTIYEIFQKMKSGFSLTEKERRFYQKSED